MADDSENNSGPGGKIPEGCQREESPVEEGKSVSLFCWVSCVLEEVEEESGFLFEKD